MKLAPATLVAVPATAVRTRHVLVDMTPLGPHGQNGGAGMVASALVRNLSALAPDLELTLLTSPGSHAELASLEAANVRRRCVSASAPTTSAVGRTLANRLLPPQARVRLKRVLWSLRKARTLGRLGEALRPDLLLCPFTVPYFWRPGVPCVSIVYDLQHLTYPHFFTAEQRLNRQRHIEDACARSDRVVCISEYVRATLLARVDVRPERVAVIPLGLLHDFGGAHTDIVERLGLNRAEFLLYPANFWPHKNHAGLFEALRLYRQNHPESRLKLVCTGASNPLMRRLTESAETQFPRGTVVFAGYVGEDELDALLRACAAVIFPSLYEGFGMPVLEAMAHGKPILCSNTTSLPEVAGDAAIYFDPTQPQRIASAIESLGDVVRIDDLVRRGRGRAAAMGTGREMAVRYLDLLRRVLAAAPPETCSVSR